MTIFIDDKELQLLVDALQEIPGGIDKAGVRAVNTTLQRSKAQATRLVNTKYNLKQKDIRGRLSIRKAQKGRLSGDLIGRGRAGLPVHKFATGVGRKAPSTRRGKGGRYTPKDGVKVKIKRSGGAKTLKGGFTAMMKNGKVGIFKRSSRKRLPIKEVYSVAPIGILDSGKFDNEIQDHAAAELDKALHNQISLLLKNK